MASLTIDRDAAWARLGREAKPFGSVDVVHETRDVGVYRLHVEPGRSIPLHVHRRMSECEMVLTDGILCQGKPVPAGTVHRWPMNAPHRYDNPTRVVQTILCVDTPPFLEEDEIEVTGDVAPVPPDLRWVSPPIVEDGA
jgi:dihydroneopterin aldolase